MTLDIKMLMAWNKRRKRRKTYKFTLAMMSGGDIAEPLSQYYLQQWKSIGLNVELVDGRLLDF